MANKTLEVKAPSGLTLTLDLFPVGSDTRANGSGDTLTERTNAGGIYSATVTEAITGWHDAVIKDDSSNVIGVGEVNIRTDTVDTYRVYDREVEVQETGVDVTEINGSSLAAQRLALTAANMIPGTVDETAFTATVTVFDCDDITEATSNHYKDRIVLFTSGVLQGQVAAITGYSLVSGRGRFTVTTMTEPPGDDDTFIVV